MIEDLRWVPITVDDFPLRVNVVNGMKLQMLIGGRWVDVEFLSPP